MNAAAGVLNSNETAAELTLFFTALSKDNVIAKLRPYRVQESHFLKSDLTRAVSRVRLYESPSLRIASACVG